MSKKDLLNEFIKSCSDRGHTRTEIEAGLVEAGWTASEATKALGTWSDTSLGVLAPRPANVTSARDFLFYGVLFGALLMTGIYLVLLLHGSIDLLFEEEFKRWRMNSLRFQIATLVVSMPVYVWLTRQDLRAVQQDPTRSRSSIRKWMVAVILLVAVSVLLGDLVWVIYELLKGDLYLPTFLKALVIALVSGGCFAFYRSELPKDT